MLKNNYHTHMRYCNHAIGDVIDYVKEAVDLKMTELGMTDHAPILESFMTKEEYDHNMCYENMKLDMIDSYLAQIEESRKLYGNKIKIYSGFESEFIPKEIEFYKNLRKRVDYLNLGIHFYPDIDGKIIDSYEGINYKNVIQYANIAIKGMETGLFNVLVHPDLFMYAYKNIEGKREFDEFAEKASIMIIESAIKNNVYVEINCNNLRNYDKLDQYETFRYPYYKFWEIAKNYKDLKIIIGADAHDPKNLSGAHIEAVIEFAKKLGLNVLEKMEINH